MANENKDLGLPCPTHHLLLQTWSKQEAIWILAHSEKLGICDSCFFHFVRIAEHEQIGRDLEEIGGAV